LSHADSAFGFPRFRFSSEATSQARNRVTVLLAESIQERLLSAGLFEYLDLRSEEKVEERVSV
jgi:hypothetical protein